MSDLNNALERIMRWLQKYQPEFANSFLPGLKPEELQLIETQLGLTLPSEICELYQWRNGTEEDAPAVCFPTMEFLPIHKAVECTQGINEYIKELAEIESPWYAKSPLFVFLQNNCDFCGIPIIKLPRKTIPVVVLGEGEMPTLFYTSITDMMQVLAECYETGAYYLDQQGYVNANKHEVNQIQKKYNS